MTFTVNKKVDCGSFAQSFAGFAFKLLHFTDFPMSNIER